MSTYLKSHTKDENFNVQHSSQDIMQMLINGALDKIKQAKTAHDAGHMTEKGFHLGRATNIIDAIRNALDPVNGDQMTKDLDAIYERVDLCIQAAVEPEYMEYLEEALDIMENIAIGCNWVPVDAQSQTQVIHAS